MSWAGMPGYAGRAVHPPQKGSKEREGGVLPTGSSSFSEMAGLFPPSSACCIMGSLKEILKDKFLKRTLIESRKWFQMEGPRCKKE